MSRPMPTPSISAPQVHPRLPHVQPSQQQPQRRPSGGRPAPTASHSQPSVPGAAHVYAKSSVTGMHSHLQPSSSSPGTRSGHRDENTRPYPSPSSAEVLYRQGASAADVKSNPNHPFLQPHRPSNPSMAPSAQQASHGAMRPAGSARLPQPPHQYKSGNRGQASDTTGSTHTSGSSEVGSLTESTRVNIIRQRGQMVDMSSPKEIVLDSPQQGYVPQVAVRDEIDIHLEHLFDTLQVPDAVRQKFSTVSPDVKSSILTSSYSSNPTILKSLGLSSTVGRSGASAHSARGPGGTPEKTKPPLRKRLSQPVLRKQKSASSIGSPGTSPQVGRTYRVDGESFTIVASPPALVSPTIGGMGTNANANASRPVPPRGQSMDLGRPSSVRTSASGSRPAAFSLFSGSNGRDRSGSQSYSGQGRAKGVGLGIAANGEQPESFIAYLRSYKGTDLSMDVDKVKKLRMVLRHEKTEWIGRFLELGGYGLVLARLQDLLDIEWREEQHDDQMLHELVRCVKALSTSEIGKSALRSSFPRPFDALSSLLFSEKKPGDLPVRQLIIELWTFVFELFPPACTAGAAPGRTAASSASSSPTMPMPPNAPFARAAQTPSGSRPTSIRFDTAQADQLAAMLDNTENNRNGGTRGKDVDAIQAVRSFLVPKQEDKAAEQHSFITQAHRPKVFRAWVQELSDICRDYFWIMCHANNTLWAEDEVDERLVTKPVAPGGATGGVEFEAMNYVITHFRLLNTLCYHLAQRDVSAAGELHENLMMSGMDRILVTMRKASTTFYPTLHLEIARYVTHLRLASPHGRLPHLIDKLVGPPPEEYRKRRDMPFHHSQSHLQSGAQNTTPRAGQRDGQRPVSYHPQAQASPRQQHQQHQQRHEPRQTANQMPVQRHSYRPAMAYDP